jgi:pilus assembly protein CpaC
MPFAEHGPNCVGDVAMHTSVVVPLGKSTMVALPEPVRTRTVGNPAVVQAMLVSPRTLYLLGSDVGTTNMIVQGRSGSCSVIDVVVGADPGGLQQAISDLMPEESGVKVKVAADTIVLMGTVSDAVQAQRVLDLANAFVQRPAAALTTQGKAAPPAAAPAPSNTATTATPPRIINMMRVAAPQQVMLEVKVAEVSKTLINELGAAANLQAGFGSWSVGLLADFLSGGLSAINLSKANNKPLRMMFDAEKDDQLVKVLAQPNLMAISGQEASFLAGGKVFIPVPQSNGNGGTTITLQAEQFGIGLTFTPTVLRDGLINLKVAPEVSELSPTGVTVTASNSNATSVLPLITTRRASTTVQLHDGQSFAIGGLLKDNVTGTIKAIPGVGELPILGALARSTNYQNDRTELVFVVTPRLAKPLPQHYPLPTDQFGQVGEAEVYATGNMEGHRRAAPTQPAPAPATPAAPVSALPAPAAPTPPAASTQPDTSTQPDAAAPADATTQPVATADPAPTPLPDAPAPAKLADDQTSTATH